MDNNIAQGSTTAHSIAQGSTDAQTIATLKWTAYCNFLTHWYYLPDLEAMECIFTICCSHFELNTEAIWMFLNGPSGSGKTSMGINSIVDLPNCHIVGKITPHTFLSGFTGKKNASFLHEIGPSGILAFKDFTTILSMRQEARTEMAGQFREIVDGYFNSRTGSKDIEDWKGKITAIAAVTGVIEEYWALTRSMGERWVQVRWPRLDGIKVAMMARKQQGHEADIQSTMRTLASDFFKSPAIKYPPPDITDDQAIMLGALAEIVAYMRSTVKRSNDGAREIMDCPQVEQTGRVGKVLAAIPRFHAALFRKSIVDNDDIRIAKRIAMDSIPYSRMRIITSIPPDDIIGEIDLLKLSGLNRSTLKWQMAELEAIGAIVHVENAIEETYRMSDHIREMWHLAYPDDHH